MKQKEKKFEHLLEAINAIIQTAEDLEEKFRTELHQVHPAYRKSALNLVHYMALRSHSIVGLQEELRLMGLPGLDNVESHVMRSLLAIKTILNHLSGEARYEHRKGTISIKKSRKILNANTRALFGYKSKKRRTRIMVTLPNTAATDKQFVNDLVGLGMNSARINCAHDDTGTWSRMIANLKEASLKRHRQLRIMMDLSGPKLRTGAMMPGPQVIRIKTEKDPLGKLTGATRVWLAPPDVPPPASDVKTAIPMSEEWLSIIKRGNHIGFTDTRGKKCKLQIAEREGKGRWATCHTSAYLVPGTELFLFKQKESGEKMFDLGEMPPIEQSIVLKTGDTLLLHRDPRPGEPAVYDDNGNVLEPAHISCTLPEIFDDVKPGEPIMFDDGMVEAVIEDVSEDEIRVKVTHAKENGSKLRSDKGINLPVSNLRVSGLTDKDREDMKFVALNADAVNFSFVNTPGDVQQLIDLLESYGSKIGIILKIETRKGFNNLPMILLTAMQTYPVGVMIARGDLAIETGWKNIATIQEEILRICEAAHVPDIWATQVLENLAKKGTPSRAEITDAAASQRAECVMLNKGLHIKKAIKLLNRILRQMQGYQNKKENILSKLEHAEDLSLRQEYS
jgi:pyruvate kinase